ncbi:MAG: septal ring lytic transglycosylase RlpA family protein [Chloroflexi bacterium]|nr:septal ring lytic transglycosylase RlpA family protein [Chloroflexota bacterium]
MWSWLRAALLVLSSLTLVSPAVLAEGPPATPGNNPPSPAKSGPPTEKPPLDWDIPNGHFYTQANGFPLGTSPRGFAVADEGGVGFWSEFKRLGGVEGVGYPVSNRLQLAGFTSQAVQKGILQWRPDIKRAWFVNVFDYLHDTGKDSWLLSFRSVPAPLHPDFDKGKNWDSILKDRRAILDAFPKLKERYSSAKDPLNLYGLPSSKVEDMGNSYVVRLQRAVLQQWKSDVPWARAGDVTVANGGDLAKEAGMLDAKLIRPSFAPTGTWKMSTAYRIDGRATWYGGKFNGRKMANGQTYDMNDPTTTASNMYPFGTKLKVTRTKTGKSLEVVVRDTGDFRHPIVVDLSHAAFGKIANPAEGVMDVTVEVMP